MISPSPLRRERSHPAARHTFPLAAQPARKWPADARMLAQQQVRLLAGQSRLLSRLLRSLLWQDLSPGEQRRILASLSQMEHDLSLTRLMTRTRPVTTGTTGEDHPAKDMAKRPSP